jgi:hypothetical protein
VALELQAKVLPVATLVQEPVAVVAAQELLAQQQLVDLDLTTRLLPQSHRLVIAAILPAVVTVDD